LRRTHQATANPHDAAWFHALEDPEDEAWITDAPHPRLRQKHNTLIVSQELPGSKAMQKADANMLKVKKEAEALEEKDERERIVPESMFQLQQVATTATPQLLTGPLRKTRAVTGNLTCAKPGCAANVTLQLYNPATEFIQDCNLTLAVHATDFDDNFAGERIANFLANGRAMGGDCYPLVNGCVSPASRELLYSCISDLPIDTIISDNGTMRVDAEIPMNVDECAYKGNLLHGVTTVNCYVGLLADLTTATTTTSTTTTSTHALANALSSPEDLDFVKKWLEDHPGKSIEDMPGYDSFYNMSDRLGGAAPADMEPVKYYGSSNTYIETQLGIGFPLSYRGQGRPVFPFRRPTELTTQAALRCAEKGCSTSLVLDFNRSLVSINRCVAQLWLNQTDFDNLDGSEEVLSVNVAGKDVLSKDKPGKNPCRSAYNGARLSSQETRYHAVKDLDLTKAMRDGPISISAQISDQVDECPSNGYLLDSELEVSCNVSTIGALLEEDQVSVSDVFELDKELLSAKSDAERDEAFKDFLEVAAASNQTEEK